MFAANALFSGTLLHRRYAPKRHELSYQVADVLVDVDRLGLLNQTSWLLGYNRRRLFSIDDRNHGAGDGSSIASHVRALMDGLHLPSRVGRIYMLCYPAVFGKVFNPLTVYFGLAEDGQWISTVYEVSNTFGEHHNYLVAHPDRRPIVAGDELTACKVFHVSPFFPVRGEYRFRFARQGTVVTTVIDYWEDGRCQLATRLSGREQPLTGGALLHWLARLPLMTFGVVARIHWQALRLAIKRVPFFRKPHPPTEEISS